MTEQQMDAAAGGGKLSAEVVELDRQREYISNIRELLAAQTRKTGSPPKMFCKTYGCQMNERDSEKIIGVLQEMGYEAAQSEQDADLVIYNTCCIRENAENKVFGNLGRLKTYKKKNPNLTIALCGCMVQQDAMAETIRKKYRHVDLIFGTFNFHRLPELLYTKMTTGQQVIDIWAAHEDIIENLPTIRRYRWKAGVNIMYGCNNFCAYCIVPYVRGRERSRRPEDILREIRALAADGVKELLLLGQNVNSYGQNLETPTSFAALLRQIQEIEGIERIRFMTPHPKDFSDELIDAIAQCGKVCAHVHLPMQSGSTKILERMNRKYTKEHYLALAEKIKARVPGVHITTDIIVGFPGEEEADFLDTLDVVRQVQFSGAFTFIYSKRSGTPAAKMPQVDEAAVKERFDRLLTEQNKITEQKNAAYLGQVVPVLVEEMSQKGDGIATGRTEGNVLVHFKGNEAMIGTLVRVRITKNRAFFLEGETIGGESNDYI